MTSPWESARDLLTDQLGRVSTLSEFNRKKIAYYTLSSYCLESLNWMPLLALLGVTGSCKSQVCEVVSDFAPRPRKRCKVTESLDELSDAELRDWLTDGLYEKLAVLEEADRSNGEGRKFEDILKDRVNRSTSHVRWRTPTQKGGLTAKEGNLFGATLAHRQDPFHSAALRRRTLEIWCVRGEQRDDLVKADGVAVSGHELLAEEEPLELPIMQRPSNINGSVYDNYSPLLGMALLLDDHNWIIQANADMILANKALAEIQNSDTILMCLRSCLDATLNTGHLDLSPVALRDLTELIETEIGKQMPSAAIGSVLRRFDFDIRISHGVTKWFPNAFKLLKACKDYGLEDECLVILESSTQSTDSTRSTRKYKSASLLP